MPESHGDFEVQHKILFVDDEPQILTAIKRAFRRNKEYILFFADSGPEGLETLKEEDIDLVVSDMRMPEMTGDVFLKEVRENYPTVQRILLTGHADLESTINAINNGGIYRFIPKPWEDEDLKQAIDEALTLKRLQAERDALMELTKRQNAKLYQMKLDLEKKVVSQNSELQQTSDMLDESFDELKKSYAQFIKVVSSVITSRNVIRNGFAKNVAELAKLTAGNLNLPQSEVDSIYHAGLLHEIGKMQLGDALLAKPLTEMTKLERYEYSRYPIFGQEALMPTHYLHDEATIIRSHREYWNGNGWPDRMRGVDIPLGSRIISVCVDYVGLLEGLLNGVKQAKKEALQFVKNHERKFYDPDILEAFFAAVESYEMSSQDKEFCLRLDEVKPGMVLSRDLHSIKGMLLLTEGTEVTGAVLAKLKNIEKREETHYLVYLSKEVQDAPSFG